MSPPMPNIVFMIFGDLIFLGFILILALFLIESIGDTLDAFFAPLKAEKYIVTIPSIAEIPIESNEKSNDNTNPAANAPFNKILLIRISTYEANSPNTTPKGIPISPREEDKKNTFFFICFLLHQYF